MEREELKTERVDLGELYRIRAGRSQNNSERVEISSSLAGARSSIDMLRS
jgi:hypothetical protein